MDKIYINNLKGELVVRDVNLFQYANMTGIAYATLHRFLSGKGNISKKTAKKICRNSAHLQLKDFGYDP